VTKSYNVTLKLLELVYKRNLEEFGEATQQKCWKQSLMSNFGGSSGDQNADRKDCSHKDSGRNEDSYGTWTRGHSCYILAKNFCTFCPCGETLRKAEFKSNGLTN
jgi:hypothetical protein